MPVNIHEAKTHLSKLVERASRGEEIVIAKAGQPVAKLVPFRAASQTRKPGGWEGQVRIAPDFDELPTEASGTFHGRRP